MKRCGESLSVVLMILLLLSGCGKANENVSVTTDSETSAEVFTEDSLSESAEPADIENDSDRSQSENTAAKEIAGVSIDFDYTRMSGKASNQIALWVEDENGETVKMIFVTDFTAARRGYENREDALKQWVEAANPADFTDDEIDAISSATPQAGTQHFVWDLMDDAGMRVPDGSYSVKLEGTLFWSSNVLYTGTVDLSKADPGEIEIVMERSEPENTDNETMIQNVRMNVMANNNNVVDNTANWLGGLEPADALEYMEEHNR